MTVPHNINRISEIYRQWQPLNNCGAPQPGDEKPLAVAPVDRVTLSAQAFKEDVKQQTTENAFSLPGAADEPAAYQSHPETRGRRIDLVA